MKYEKIIKRIKALYKKFNPYCLEENDTYFSKNIEKNQDLVPTYGEILPKAVSKLIENLNIKDNDVFVDLGCGNGKVVLQFYLQTQVKYSLGIEFSTTRFKQATEVKNKIILNPNKKIEFIRGNFLNKEIDLSNGTIFYIASTCFSDKTMIKIWNKIIKSKNLKAVIALNEFPNTCNFSKVKKIKDIMVGCSWAISKTKIYYF